MRAKSAGDGLHLWRESMTPKHGVQDAEGVAYLVY